jgi:hypothetical protein
MTAPVSLLSLLGGSDPAPQGQTSVDDPAAFAAALAAAIQLLQPTAPLTQAPVVVTLPADGEQDPSGESAEGDTQAKAQSDGAGIEIAVALPVAGQPIELDGATEIDPMFEGPLSADDQSATTAAGTDTAMAPCGVGDGEHQNIDAAAADPAAAAPAAMPARQSEAKGQIKLPWHPSRKRTAPPDVPAPVAAPAPPKGTEPARPSRPAQVDASPTQAPVVPTIEVRTVAGKSETPKTRKSRDEVSADEPSSPYADTARQVDAGPTPPVIATMQAILQSVLPVIKAVTDQLSAKGRQAEKPASPAPAPALLAEPATGAEAEPWSQAGNARLATQLAEIMEGLNLNEFRVELSKRGGSQPASQARVSPTLTEPEAASPTSEPAPSAAESAQSAPVGAIITESVLIEAVTAPTTESGEPKRKLVAQESHATEPAAVSSPKTGLQSGKPVSFPAATVPAADNDLDTSVELPVTLPRRLPQRSAEPTLPVARQELPQPDHSARNAALAEPSRQRDRHEGPSGSAASASGPQMSPAERVLARNQETGARESREARNLPQPDTGDNRPAGSADRVTLQVSDSEGRQTRIRVTVVGDQVRAVITPPDNESARQLEHRMDELQTALARQGFTATRVSIQAAADGGGEAMAGAGVAASSSEARTTPGKDQPAGDQRQGRNPREQQSQGGGQQQRQSHGRNRDQGAEQRRREHA